jgi:glutamate N-acetyltransferase/amino-acid N-acetyltransferase
MARLAADELAISPGETAVASTGVIGVPFPIDAVRYSMEALANSLRGDAAGHDAALEAIMTTDTRKKDVSLEFSVEGVPVRIGGMAKGAGMIHPNLATMLSFITTDAAVSPALLDRALKAAAARSFNRLTVDGDTSTNDTVMVMANGLAGNPAIDAPGPGYDAFAAGLEAACVRLARAIARDGEGAARLIAVEVSGAAGEEDAAILAKAVAGSSLVKAALGGADANWGRVLCALGYAGPEFDPGKTSLAFKSRAGELAVFERGAPLLFDEAAAKAVLGEAEITIACRVGNGPGAAAAWGCDLTCEYVKINGDYRS